jgi:hypothetical protein
MLADTELAGNWELLALTAAIEIANQEGMSQEASHLIREAEPIADRLPDNELSAWFKWKFFSSAGYAAKATEVCKVRTKADSFFIAADCLMNLELADPMSKFEELTKPQHNALPHAILTRAHVLANQPDAKRQIETLVKPLLKNPGPIIRRHSLAVLCLVCTPEEIRRYARDCNRSKAMERFDSIWKGEQMVNYYAGEIETDDLLAVCRDSSFALSNAYFTIGTMLLAEGKRNEAIEHLKQGLLQGNGTSIDYTLCKAYWKRLSGDDRWLARGPH